MFSSRYVIAGLHFITVYLILSLLILSQTNARDRWNFPFNHQSEPDDEFDFSEEQQMSNFTREYCGCANPVLQSMFCQQDFGKSLI